MRNAGFTLIELMVSVSVIVMMLAVTLPAFGTFQRNQSIKNAAETIREAILETNNYALAPRSGKTADESKPADGNYYRIIFTLANADKNQPIYNNKSTYQIDESATSDLAGPQWHTIKIATLPDNITFATSATAYYTKSVFPVTSLNNPSGDLAAGIVYSIKDAGAIVKPCQAGIIRLAIEFVGTSANAKPQKFIEIHPQTGQVDVLDNPTQVDSSDSNSAVYTYCGSL